MRIWDIDPGYLNRGSLLGEHRELHGIVSIIINGKSGYRNHPETQRWLPFRWGLMQRHRLLVAEMTLRGYQHHSPVLLRRNSGRWPSSYIDLPGEQFQILIEKYRDKGPGRIPLPKNGQQLWAQYKYSVMARSVPLYKEIGKMVATMRKGHDFSKLTELLVETLRERPAERGIRNVLHHMWGYLSHHEPDIKQRINHYSLKRLLREIQHRAIKHNTTYLIHSTALGELMGWL